MAARSSGVSPMHDQPITRLVRRPRPVEPGIYARTYGLDGETRGGAGAGKALQTQHVVLADGPLDQPEQFVLAGRCRQRDGEGVEIVVLVAFAVMLQLMQGLAAGKVVLGGETEAEQRVDIGVAVGGTDDAGAGPELRFRLRSTSASASAETIGL